MKTRAPQDLHLSVLPPTTQAGFVTCTSIAFLENNGWYLAGGMALALQIGHRESVDLDFFTRETSFSYSDMEEKLSKIGTWDRTLLREGTLYGTINSAKVSFIAYPFFHPSEPGVVCVKREY